MITSRELLAAVRAAQGFRSNYALSKALDVREHDVSRWNGGHNTPSDPMAIRLAELAGLDPAYVLASMHAQRCTDATIRPILERIAAGVAKAGATTAAAVLAGFISVHPDAGAVAASPSQGPATACLYIMSNQVARLCSAARRVLSGIAAQFGAQAQPA